jgi:hypothetical protein
MRNDQENPEKDQLPEEDSDSDKEHSEDDQLPEEDSDCDQEHSEDGLLPGEDFNIEEVGSQIIEKEDTTLVVKGWSPLVIPLAQTIKKFFPPRR